MKKSLVLAMAMALGVTASATLHNPSLMYQLATGHMTASLNWQLLA